MMPELINPIPISFLFVGFYFFIQHYDRKVKMVAKELASKFVYC